MTTPFRFAVLGLALLVSAGLAGCGFTPLYAGGGVGGNPRTSAELGAIEIEELEGRIGFDVREGLLDRLAPHGTTASPRYLLSVKLKESREGLAIQKDTSITRFNYELRGKFRLVDIADPAKVLYEGDARAIAAYNVVDNQFATLTARRDAEERAAGELAEDIRIQLALFFDKAGR